MAQYEFWLADDSGRRLTLLDQLAFASYTRSSIGLGTINIGMPFDPFFKKFNPYFRPDWRVEVWRSPQEGVPMRLEDVFLLRKPNVYVRQEDSTPMLQFYGRNGLDLLYRRAVIQLPGTSYTSKTTYADNIMKAIVREQMLYGSCVSETGAADNTRAWPQNEFFVQQDLSLGPTLTRNFEGKDVIDILKELRAATFQLNISSASNRRIFFGIVPVNISGYATPYASTLGWEFRTYADLYGTDRTTGIVFSHENENIESPTYSKSHLEEVNTVYVTNGSGASVSAITKVEDASRSGASRWNRCEKLISASSSATSTSDLTNAGYSELYNKRPVEEFPVTFLNTVGSPSTPRSLYGLDWDLGDLLRVGFAGKQFNVEVNIVYVSVDEDGKETITGRNEVNATQ